MSLGQYIVVRPHDVPSRPLFPPPVPCPCRSGVNCMWFHIMRRLAFLLLCAAFPPVAFAQNASSNAIAGMGYLYPEPVVVAPGQLIAIDYGVRSGKSSRQ